MAEPSAFHVLLRPLFLTISQDRCLGFTVVDMVLVVQQIVQRAFHSLVGGLWW